MNISDKNVLLIGKSEDSSKFFIETIEGKGAKVIYVSTIEMAIQQSLNALPDVIVCFYELNDLNGFQVFNILEREILRNEIPYILIFNQLRKNELFVAIELGIDSFIYPPYDAERIGNIILKQIEKNADRKSSAMTKFESLSKIIPYAVFVAENNKIVQANKSFTRLVENSLRGNGNCCYLNDVFVFNNDNTDELKLARFMNGLSNDCCFQNIKMKGNGTGAFNLYLSQLRLKGSTSKVVGIVIPEKEQDENDSFMTFASNFKKEKSEFLNPNLITARERQVLELSATGIPIKQIAERLGISERTVEKHRSNIIQKTKTENIMEAVYLFGKNHLLNA